MSCEPRGCPWRREAEGRALGDILLKYGRALCLRTLCSRRSEFLELEENKRKPGRSSSGIRPGFKPSSVCTNNQSRRTSPRPFRGNLGPGWGTVSVPSPVSMVSSSKIRMAVTRVCLFIFKKPARPESQFLDSTIFVIRHFLHSGTLSISRGGLWKRVS